MDVLHILLVLSTGLLVGLGLCLVIRLRRLSRASDTQFLRAVKEAEPPANEETQ